MECIVHARLLVASIRCSLNSRAGTVFIELQLLASRYGRNFVLNGLGPESVILEV